MALTLRQLNHYNVIDMLSCQRVCDVCVFYEYASTNQYLFPISRLLLKTSVTCQFGIVAHHLVSKLTGLSQFGPETHPSYDDTLIPSLSRLTAFRTVWENHKPCFSHTWTYETIGLTNATDFWVFAPHLQKLTWHLSTSRPPSLC